MNSIIEQLRLQIRSVETQNRNDDGTIIGNGCEAMDQLLPVRGYFPGSLVQWITAGGEGADYLSLKVASQACAHGGALVVIDPLQQFYPPAATAAGINLENVIVLHPNDRNDLLWSIDQSLRCPAVAAVWNPFGALPPIDELWFRRFQLSAESSGAIGLFVQPLIAARLPSWAEVQWLVSSFSRNLLNQAERVNQGCSTESTNSNQFCQLELSRCRGGQVGRKIQVCIDLISGTISANSTTLAHCATIANSTNTAIPALRSIRTDHDYHTSLRTTLTAPNRLPVAS